MLSPSAVDPNSVGRQSSEIPRAWNWLHAPMTWVPTEASRYNPGPLRCKFQHKLSHDERTKADWGPPGPLFLKGQFDVLTVKALQD